MSSKGRRLAATTVAEASMWGPPPGGPGAEAPSAVQSIWQAGDAMWSRAQAQAAAPPPAPAQTPPPDAQTPPPMTPAEQQDHLAALERDAFTKGYAQGERAGLEAGGQRAEAMLRRLASTVDELGTLRDEMVRQTEQQVVTLALAIARRVLHREASIDPELAGALAHVALDRLGPASPATIRLHPDDYTTVGSHAADGWNGRAVKVVPDPAVARGGCLVESDFGYIDASVDAQVDEIARAMLGESRPVPVARRGAA
jgi:flagellar assembly protein FliH